MTKRFCCVLLFRQPISMLFWCGSDRTRTACFCASIHKKRKNRRMHNRTTGNPSDTIQSRFCEGNQEEEEDVDEVEEEKEKRSNNFTSN